MKKKKKKLQLHRFPTKQKISKLILINFFLNRNDRDFSQNDSATNSSRNLLAVISKKKKKNLLATLDTEPDVAVVIIDDDEGLEASSLINTGLFLNGQDLHDLVL